MKSLNFNAIPKSYFNVTLADEKQTTLIIKAPTKKVLDDLLSVQEKAKNGFDVETMDDLYVICAKVMSDNKAGIKITSDFLEDLFDFEDLVQFVNAYMEFVSEITSSKN